MDFEWLNGLRNLLHRTIYVYVYAFSLGKQILFISLANDGGNKEESRSVH